MRHVRLAPFVCPVCGSVSWNPNDIDFGYCGRCHWWTGDELLGEYPELVLDPKERI